MTNSGLNTFFPTLCQRTLSSHWSRGGHMIQYWLPIGWGMRGRCQAVKFTASTPIINMGTDMRYFLPQPPWFLKGQTRLFFSLFLGRANPYNENMLSLTFKREKINSKL